MAELIVVTGGAYAGKTTLVTALAARGHATLPEAAIEVISELNVEHGVAGQAAWRRANLVAFQRRVTIRQHEREAEARADAAPRIFCDRGFLDGKAYCSLAGAEWPEDLETLTGDRRYAHVFLLETLAAFDGRRDTGRLDTYDESVRTLDLLETLYAPRADSLTRIPEASLEERIDLVLRALAERSG